MPRRSRTVSGEADAGLPKATGLVGSNATIALLIDHPQVVLKTFTRSGVAYSIGRDAMPRLVAERQISKGILVPAESRDDWTDPQTYILSSAWGGLNASS